MSQPNDDVASGSRDGLEPLESLGEEEAFIKKLDSKISDPSFEGTFSLPYATISRVPKELYKLKEGAYTPNLFSIGPLHINEINLQSLVTEDIKAKYFCNLSYRTFQAGCDVDVEDSTREWYGEMKKLVKEARASYAEYVDEKLTAERMLVDGCFILELLFRNYLYKHPEEHDGEGAFYLHEEDPYVVNMQTRATVQHDFLLLGNQLPFQVLQKLFELTVDRFQIKKDPKRTLSDYVLLYMDIKMSTPYPDKKNTNRATNSCFPRAKDWVLSICGPTENEGGQSVAETKREENTYRHILDVVHHNYLRFDLPKNKGGTGRLTIMPCASELDFAGVKFVVSSRTREGLFRVKFGRKRHLCWWFRRAEFEIPKLTVDYTTEPLLRNLIAFEKCVPGVPNHVTSFVFLLGFLVETQKDVQVLVKAGIIENFLGTNQDAADLFNNLCKEVVPGEFPFADKCSEVVEYSKLCWPKNIAHVRRTYFASPWTFIAFCGGFILFGIAVAQFILGLT